LFGTNVLLAPTVSDGGGTTGTPPVLTHLHRRRSIASAGDDRLSTFVFDNAMRPDNS